MVLDLSLAHAVEGLSSVTQAIADSDLERAWAWGVYDSEGVRFAFFRTYEELRELAAEIAGQRAASGRHPSMAQRILGQYHAAYRDLQAALLGVEDAYADLAPAEGEWPIRRVSAHIVGADIGFFVVVRYALDRQRAGDGRPAQVPDEAWESILGQDISSLEAILDGPLPGIEAYYEELHQRILSELSSIRDKELSTPSMYWESTEMSLRFRLHRFDSHLRQHTVQVDKTLSALGRAPSEVRRLLRLVYAALAEAEGATIGAWKAGEELRRSVALAITDRTSELKAILCS